MGSTRAKWLPWAFCGLVTCLAVTWSGFQLLSRNEADDAAELTSSVLFTLPVPLVFAFVAALIVSRQPRNTIGWLLMIPVGLFLVGMPVEVYIERLAPSSPLPSPVLLLLVWFYNWNWLLLIFPLLYIPLLFPNGRPPTPRWRGVSIAMLVWAALFVLIVMFVQPARANTNPDLVVDNPVGILSQATAERLASVWFFGLVALVLLCVTALFVRYRRANVTERAQIQWLLYVSAMFLVVFGAGNWLGEPTGVADLVWEVFFALSVVSLPVAIGIAVLRYHLYDIDLIIRKTLVYSALTAILGALYVGSVLLLQVVLSPLTGGSSLAIAVSTLVVAALFQPVRRRIQVNVDRRFFRQKYDADRMLSAFGRMARDEVDLERLTTAVVAVIGETMQPEHVSVWLPDRARDQKRARRA